MAKNGTHISGPLVVGGVEVISAAGAITGNIVATAGSIGAAELAADVAVAGTSVARTATATGATTGTIADTTGNVFVTVTSDSADKIIILPAPVVGIVVTLINGATGYEIRSSTPASIGINGGVGAAAESAVAANMTEKLTCVSATNWVGQSFTAAGVVGVTEVAA